MTRSPIGKPPIPPEIGLRFVGLPIWSFPDLSSFDLPRIVVMGRMVVRFSFSVFRVPILIFLIEIAL
jgi:hypothetical protein